MPPQKAYGQRNRKPGYDPRKIFDYWFCRGVQSAIFHYASCTDWKNYKAAKERKKQAEKRAKERDAELAIITEQPRSIPQMQPLPSETNKGWAAEIKMGRKYDPRQTIDRRVSSGNTRLRANTGDSDRYDYYRAKNPEFDERSPPIVCKLPPPERKDEVEWMKAPAPSRAVMEGREFSSENALPRWPLCVIEQTSDEYYEGLRSMHEHYALLRSMQRTPEESCTGAKLSKKERRALFEHRLKDDAAQFDAKISLPEKPQKAFMISPNIPKGLEDTMDYDAYSDWSRPDPRNNTRETIPTQSSTPISYFDDTLSKSSIATPPGRSWFRKPDSDSWASGWDSEPDTYESPTSTFHVHGGRRSKSRISGLVLVHEGEKSEIRGASYTYESFWNTHARSRSIS